MKNLGRCQEKFFFAGSLSTTKITVPGGVGAMGWL